MSRRQPPSGASGLPQQTRQNEYFVPRDGIDREVITADICRYLGNDALVRPGNYENPDNGQTIQGYYINAYRNLTSAMIQDLKADSARWDQERRQQSANRNSAGGVQYRNSDIHQSRQYYGPTEAPGYSAPSAGDQYDAPRYPGTGNGAFNGASGGYQGQPQYTTSAGGYPSQGYTQATGYAAAPPAGVSYSATAHTVSAPGFGGVQDAPYQMVGHDSRAAAAPQASYANDPYARDPRGDLRVDPRDQRGVPVSSMGPARTTYSTAGPVPPQGYAASSPSTGYYPSGGPQNTAYVQQAQDPFYGRASPAGTAAYGTAAPDQHSSRHRNDRESVERHPERHSDSRHTHRSHRPGR